MGPEGVKHVLCAVGDITSSVLLARELHDSQENANQQLDMMLGMMHVDPLQLVSFLDTAETGLKLVNTILKEPARTDAEFRKKLTGLFREMHAIKGEASALNLKSIASRVHALEDMVSECKKRPELSGNDFLPLVLKLDDLLAHLRSVREMAARLTALKDTPAAAARCRAARPCPQRRRRAERRRARAATRRRRPVPDAAVDGRAPGAGSRQALQALAQRPERGAGRLQRHHQGLPHPDAAQRGGARHRDHRTCAAARPRRTSAWCASISARPARATSSCSRTTAPASPPSRCKAAAVRQQTDHRGGSLAHGHALDHGTDLPARLLHAG